MKTLLIDGDILAYLSACRCDSPVDWDCDGEITNHTDESVITQIVDQTIADWLKKSGCTKAVIALSDPSRRYFRHDLWPAYKAHRSGRPPAALGFVKEYLKTTWKGVSMPNLEADDVLGILATNGEHVGAGLHLHNPVICTIDKDLLQVPGEHYNPKTGALRTITPFEGMWMFYRQSLSGDPVDGFPGCPRVGLVRAETLLYKHVTERGELGEVSLWKAIVELYEARGLNEEYALTQARVAKILQAEDWSVGQQRPVLWEPKRRVVRTSGGQSGRLSEFAQLLRDL